jgi:serine/threonine-protein kinase
MQPERWGQIENIVQSAVDYAPADRAEFLNSVCGDDAELRREVESLLAAHESGGLTGSSGFEDAMKVLTRQNEKLSEGRRIGAYRVLKEIGRGGMGTVYLAERADEAFQKLAAIKIIRRGLDTDDIIQRFHTERQILATLDHPNIARLLDGGTTGDGLPYFVMEHIEGEPIDVYCAGHALAIPERLKLFQGVCASVSYAHQNLVVHRDIKPGNVLVTKEGIPRLLDFGIAKLLAPDVAQQRTQTGVRPLTPEYASPEQIRGEPITTASDIYSLGVLLYWLIAGKSPYRSAMSSAGEIERAIGEEQPELPSGRAPKELRRQIEGDLDTIVLTALRKEPRRRYSSVEKLSEDIRRYLADLPIAARRDTRGYRARKFVRRNKAWVAAAAAMIVILAGGIATTLWQSHVAREQRDLARRQQAKAARINTFLQEMVGYSGVALGTGNQKYNATVAEMLDDAARRLDTELADQPEVKAALLGTIGNTYAGQARLEPATRYLRQAYDMDLKLFGPNSLITASAAQGLANLCYRSGDYAGGDRWVEKVLPVYRRYANDPELEVRFLVGGLSDAAFAKRALGKFDEAEALWREALTHAPRLPDKYRGVGITPKTFLAQLYVDRGDVEKADPLASEAARDLRALGTERFGLAQSLIDLGNVRRLQERYSESEPLIQEGTNLYAQLQGDHHPNVAYGTWILSSLHYDQARYDLSEQDARKVLEIVEQLPKGTSYYAAAYGALGRVLNKTGRAREAEPLLRDALAILRKSPRKNDAAGGLGYLGECLQAQERYVEAEPLLLESYQTLKSTQVPGSPALKKSRERLTALYAAWGKPAPSPL